MVVLTPRPDQEAYNVNHILYWNYAALDLVRLTHTKTATGPINGPPLVARMLGILHLAIHDAYFGINTSSGINTYLSLDPAATAEYRLPAPPATGPSLPIRDARLAVAGAAITVLEQQYTTPDPTIAIAATDASSQLLKQHATNFTNLDTLSPSYQFGVAVGRAILGLLAIKPDEIGTKQDSYRPTPGQYKFNDDPTNPVRLRPVNVNDPNGPQRAVKEYHAPFYGMTAKRLAVQYQIDTVATEHIIADPPVGVVGGTEVLAEYYEAFQDVYRMGGRSEFNSTKRRPAQTTAAHFWAYDGSNLIGVPLRFYNQILRAVAWKEKPDDADPTSEANNAEFARLFALANVAMADAGIFAWQEKYCFELWRPLSGVREDDRIPLQDPHWLELGAPSTNSNEISFKPPFPSYPSGHATFGGALFQMMRLYYRNCTPKAGADPNRFNFSEQTADKIDFEIFSDEQDGIHRDLTDPYNPNLPIDAQRGIVRTFWQRKFNSLWEAMWENAVSRVWLGVHWSFDAFAPEDMLRPNLNPAGIAASPSSISTYGPPPAVNNKYAIETDGTTSYIDPKSVKYKKMGARADRPAQGSKYPIGGVPLGMGIATDIWQSQLKPTPVKKQPSGREKCGDQYVLLPLDEIQPQPMPPGAQQIVIGS